MLGPLLIFVLTAASLALLFWVGGLFLQGYLYTQPSQNLYWQAPVAGAILAGYITMWCVLILNSPSAVPGNIPYDTLFRFNATEDMGTEAVKELTVIPKKGDPIVFKSHRVGQRKWKYENDAKKPWDRNPQAILLSYKGEQLRFAPANPDIPSADFFSDKGGWVLKVFDDGTDGQPEAFRFNRFLANVALNAFFVVLWIGAMFLIRFLPGHALLIGIILWLVATLTLLPMLFSYAAETAQKQHRSAVKTALLMDRGLTV